MKNQYNKWIVNTNPHFTDDYLVEVEINYGGTGMHKYFRTGTYNTKTNNWAIHEDIRNCVIGEVLRWKTIE